MKNLLSLLAIVFIFAACSSDDDNADQVASLTGTWKLTEFDAETDFDFNGDGTASTSIMDETNCYQNELFVFSSDGTGVATNSSYADIELIAITDDTTTGYYYEVDCIQDLETNAFTFIQSENTVSIVSPGFTIEGTVSGNIMTIVVPSGFAVEVEEGNGTAVTTEDLTFVYTKQ